MSKRVPLSDVGAPDVLAAGDTLSVAFVGAVDHGKSTLLGRLLYDTGAATPDRLTTPISEGGLAFLLDGLTDERERLFTLDTAQAVLETERRKYVLIDVPGHAELLKNMATGASLAQVGVVVVDCTEQVVPQTLGHLQVLELLGIRTCVCAVTKMDLVAWDEAPFRAVADEVARLAASCGVQIAGAVPLSAVAGVNVHGPRSVEHATWYGGPSLLGALNLLSAPSLRASPLRISVEGALGVGPNRRVLARVLTGTARPGQPLIDGSQTLRCMIDRIERFGEPPLDAAFAGDSVGLMIEGDQPAVGTLLSSVDEPLEWGRIWCARVLSTSTTAFAPGDDCLLRHCGSSLIGRIAAVRHRSDASSASVFGELVDVRILLADPAAADCGRLCPPLARFVLATPDGAPLGAAIIHRVEGIAPPSRPSNGAAAP